MAPEQRPDEPGVDGQAGERDPADIDGFDLEALWQLCTPSPGKPRHDPLIGVEFNGVRLSRVLGEGGMGRVYEGHSIDGSGKVAVKVPAAGAAKPQS
jgi:serine/threonine protein kinase